jgi:protein SCO1/2
MLQAGAVACFECLHSPASRQFRGIDITGADYARGFALTDFNGQPRTLGDFAGKVVVVFFGYTQCPDVCPTTMSEMAQVKQMLGADGDRLQVLFVSVDPERDTPEVLKAYMAAFDPGFLALYAASPDQLAALAKDFKVYYKKRGRQDPHQLHHGPHRRQLRLRPAGPAAPVQPLRQRRAGHGRGREAAAERRLTVRQLG